MPDKKILMVLPPLDFDGDIFDVVRRILEGRGHKVMTTSIAQGVVSSKEGYSVPVDMEVRDVRYYDYDAFVFVGGDGARIYFEDERVRTLAKDAKWKTLAATGAATVVLAFADVLDKKRVTGAADYAGLLIGKGAVFTNQPYEIDEKIITLQDENVTEYFANAIVRAIES